MNQINFNSPLNFAKKLTREEMRNVRGGKERNSTCWYEDSFGNVSSDSCPASAEDCAEICVADENFTCLGCAEVIG